MDLKREDVMPSVSHTSMLSAVDNRMIAAMRLILAVSALLIISIDPFDPNHYVAVTYMALTLYVAYSATLFVCAWRCVPLALATMEHWIDVGWYVILIGLSNGTNSVFFFFLFFAILVASVSGVLAQGYAWRSFRRRCSPSLAS